MSADRRDTPSETFMIVVATGKKFDVGLADGIYPWRHHATCDRRTDANRICTMLAMHYRVRSYPLEASNVR